MDRAYKVYKVCSNMQMMRKYHIVEKIGSGSFGDIFKVVRKDNGQQFALKFESKDVGYQQLHLEYQVYSFLSPGLGIARVYEFGWAANGKVMVMELLGPSLEDLFGYCSCRFSLKTVLMLAMQMIDRLEYVHMKGYVHRDIKPDNFAMSAQTDKNLLYLIDFGLANRYMDVTKREHIPFGWKKDQITGTLRYASLNAQQGFEVSRRDDMISLGYVWMYFLRGSLPWQGMIGPRRQRLERIVELKRSLKIDEFCKGFPDVFANYLINCQSLAYNEEPNYLSIRCSFSDLFTSLKYINDGVFDWSKDKKSSEEDDKENQKAQNNAD
ncbi:casein kinase I [Drosophila nasuta]|uniref:casein kinase I n=1 Tax=Drosophila nasuta TaxID=42062 RepID=UPI00295F4A97|nr:casein kinase I [Drosophila nasuta]